MGSLTVLVVLMCLGATHANSIQKQNCDRDDFSCDYNNPCDPLCEEGQVYYTGTSIRKYVECSGENLEICTELQCPRRHYWNKHTESCELRSQDCDSRTFTCDYNNPCRPLCNEDQFFYPGNWPNKYIECAGGSHGMCKERTCPNEHYWNRHTESCLPRKQDCSLDKFSCDYNNPCKPICDAEQTTYPGNWPNNYIECSGDLLMKCESKKCPSKHYYNKHTHSCQEVSQDCDGDSFSCDYNNPCKPICNPGQLIYPGNWFNNYIECSGELLAKCTEKTCGPREEFDSEALECVPKVEDDRDCESDHFSCDYNNPCNPGLCEAGVRKYPGNWPNNFIKCIGFRGRICVDRNCPPKHYYNKHTQDCREVSQVCAADKFSCDYNNPCKPLCDENKLRYPGNWANKFIECSGVAKRTCTKHTCDRGTHYNDSTQQCE